ncbi:MAG: TIGR00282 family metallophosphoesterase [Desulfohalobiaceae bacterium]|nr:TIGR00282 family metallophosphoesterase [Desulfohalobiaceae bacterium]
MRILFLGDIVGKQARKAVTENIGRLRQDLDLDLILANAENASGGLGLVPKNASELHNAGIDVLTSGNHIWKHKEIYNFLNESRWLLRPANYPPEAPGRGYNLFSIARLRVGVINLLGRVFMSPVDCPFRTAGSILETLKQEADIVLVDFHAEATSEKKALGYYLAGRVSALLGTHTHVQTGDAQILSGGTGYITDLGMCGPSHSVLGMDPETVQRGFVQGLPQRFVLAGGEIKLQGALLDIDAQSGRTLNIQVWEAQGPLNC